MNSVVGTRGTRADARVVDRRGRHIENMGMRLMGRAGRFFGVFAVAAIVLASMLQGYEPVPALAVAAPATSGDAAAAADAPAAAKARQNRKKKNRKRNNRPRPPVVSAGADCLRVMVPAYFEPQEYWDGINAAASTTGLVILNPNSGPDKPDATWKARTQAAQAEGITVIGYVLTDEGERPQAAVRADIKAYYDWFGVDGIYLDETSSNAEDVAYYREMAAYARKLKPGAVIAVNPGYTPPEAFMKFANYVETFEYDFATYEKQTFPAWTRNYSADRFIHVVHSVPDDVDAAQRVLALARERNAGWVFMTDETNPDVIYKSLGGNLWDETINGACPPV
jgi:hypothetical protein